ncbi:MAG: SDR family oxidoreductase [Armatimonadetes bacterium]|nr:SDR family oxidoreductase [Anaerolineae bacterium]
MQPGSVVLITGASSGIGQAMAVACAGRGWQVAGTARNSTSLAETQARILALPDPHGDFLPIAADVRDPDAMHDAVRQTVEHFGRLDLLVANAGVGHRGGIADAEWGDLDLLLRTNIDGVLHSVRAAVPAMRASGQGGHIVLISSVVHNMTAPYAAAYAASKAFVSSLARSLRLELEADDIFVTDMWIGRTETQFSERRLGTPSRASSGGLPEMSAQTVAEGIINAVQQKRRGGALRWIDRLLLLANRLIPTRIGRRALRQYKP